MRTAIHGPAPPGRPPGSTGVWRMTRRTLTQAVRQRRQPGWRPARGRPAAVAGYCSASSRPSGPARATHLSSADPLSPCQGRLRRLISRPASRGLRGARRSGAYPRRRSLAVDVRNSRNSGKSTTAPRCACPDKCGSPACRWRHCRIPQERTDSRSDRVFCFPACGRLLGIGRAASTARLRTCALSPKRKLARSRGRGGSDRRR
jgi:hypothetical protein